MSLAFHPQAQTLPDGTVSTRLEMSKDTVMVGEPAYFYFVVTNHLAQEIFVEEGGDYRNELGRPETFQVTVTNQAGDTVHMPRISWTAGGMFGFRAIPPKGEARFNLFLSDWATIEKEGDYRVQAAKSLRVSPFNAFTTHDYSRIRSFPEHAEAFFHATAKNEEAMGRLIETIGSAMLEEDYHVNQDSLAHLLAAIHDERTIPYHTAVLKTSKSSGLIHVSIRALSNYTKNQAAREALVYATTIPFERFAERVTKIELAVGSANGIRAMAVDALAKQGKSVVPFLLSLQGDEHYSVRLKVMQQVYRLDPTAALPMLEAYRTDADQRVRDEAIMLLGKMKGRD